MEKSATGWIVTLVGVRLLIISVSISIQFFCGIFASDVRGSSSCSWEDILDMDCRRGWSKRHFYEFCSQSRGHPKMLWNVVRKLPKVFTAPICLRRSFLNFVWTNMLVPSEEARVCRTCSLISRAILTHFWLGTLRENRRDFPCMFDVFSFLVKVLLTGHLTRIDCATLRMDTSYYLCWIHAE